ncbi:MAG: outer membrane beta-barrel protein [Elusimicrobiota bacterium]|nr:outer membrane beta-barrel protein [Elusimicrobiota bacterium]
MKLIAKVVMPLLAVAFCLMAINARAVDLTPYASVKAAYTSIQNKDFDYDKSLNSKLAVGVGADVGKEGVLRAELEYSGTSASYYTYTGTTASGGTNEEASSKTENKTLLLNAYFDIKTGTVFTPYIGAGFGINNSSLETNFISGRYSVPVSIVSGWKPAWDIGAGVGIKVAKTLTLDIGYRYSDLGTFKGRYGLYYDDGTSVARVAEGEAKYALTSHEAVLGVRYTF